MTDYCFRKSPHSFYTNNVEAQDAGEELERINEKYGQTTASNVVDESRPEKAVLHEAFEWDDEVAAEEHRKTQARSLIKTVRVIHPEEGEQPELGAHCGGQRETQLFGDRASEQHRLKRVEADARE